MPGQSQNLIFAGHLVGSVERVRHLDLGGTGRTLGPCRQLIGPEELLSSSIGLTTFVAGRDKLFLLTQPWRVFRVFAFVSCHVAKLPLVDFRGPKFTYAARLSGRRLGLGASPRRCRCCCRLLRRRSCCRLGLPRPLLRSCRRLLRPLLRSCCRLLRSWPLLRSWRTLRCRSLCPASQRKLHKLLLPLAAPRLLGVLLGLEEPG